MKEKKITAVRVGVLLLAALFFAVLHWILREKVPERQVRLAVLACTEESAAHPFSGYGFITGRWLCLLMISVKCWMP